MCLGVHRDYAGTDLQIFNRFDIVTNFIGRVAAALNGVNQHFARVIAERRENVGVFFVRRLVSVDKVFNFGVAFKVVRAEIRIVKSVRAGNFYNF